MSDATDDTTDDDDLDITNFVKKDLGHDDSLRESSSLRQDRPNTSTIHDEGIGDTESADEDDEISEDGDRPPQGHPSRPKGSKIDWSEDEDEVDDNLRNLTTTKRKRTVASTHEGNVIENKKGRKLVGGDGLRRKKRKVNGRSTKAAKKERQWGDETDDDHLMEYTLPDYLQKRRTKFDTRYQKMADLGLRLPPRYDEVVFSEDEHLEDLLERPEFPNAKPVAPYEDKHLPKSLGVIPAAISQWLRDYQVDGTAFLHALFVYQTGGILGDDMGLGKTVQVIAFLTAAFGKTGDERDAKRMRKMRRANAPWYPRALVVCPGTLIENWKDELTRWGWWHVDVYHGEAGAREAALQAAATGRVEILITTYATYRLNKGAINLVEWDCVIADECHQVKGRNSETTLAMNEVNALCRVGLTGTAIQNSYDELWTLLNWTNPGKFGPISTWKSSITEPLRQGQSHDATHYQLSKARKTAKALVQNLLPQFFLRRMKTLIADQLPKKSDRVVFCPLTDVQADAYENCIDNDIIRYIRESSDFCPCGSKKKAGWCCQTRLPDGSKWQSHVFPAISHLQKLSNHLAILIPQSSDPQEKQSKDLETLQVAVPHLWKDLYRTRDSILNYSNPEFCGKWKILKKLLRFWHCNGDKVLVFSHSVRLLKMLQLLFQHTTYNVSYLDGAMSYGDRAAVVADFNADPAQFVFLISTKAGGVGLNITSANKVVVVDPNWNPSYDLQAQDRAYRIGQVRDVEVFRLVSAGTIEEIVYARQVYKQQQANIGYTASTERRYFRGVQENAQQKGEIFGLANLFNYQHENLVLKDIVNKTNVAESKAGVAIAGVEFDSGPSAGSHNHNNEDVNLTDPDSLPPPAEDNAMSQLAAMIVDDKNPDDDTTTKPNPKQPYKKEPTATTTLPPNRSRDPIQAILANAGVEYSHENSEVVGSSRVEAGLSRRALEAGADLGLGDRHVFPTGGSQSQDGMQRRGGHPVPRPLPSMEAAHNEDAGNGVTAAAAIHTSHDNDHHQPGIHIRYKYNPPPAIRKRQLCTMATHFGFADRVVEFAAEVEGWTQARRRAALEKFYRERRKFLREMEEGVVDGVEMVRRRGSGEEGKGEGEGGSAGHYGSDEDDDDNDDGLLGSDKETGRDGPPYGQDAWEL